MKKSLSQRQIPTLLGIAILVISLIAGIALIGKGGEIFAPRAAPQTTPKKVVISNIKEDSFSVSFITDDTTAAFLRYGTKSTNLDTQSSDDRDQLSGSVGQFTTHYITVRDLQPGTTYYYILGTGSNSKFDNNGVPFQVVTAAKAGTPPIARTIYGTVYNADNTPAAGAIVYVNINGVSELSALTKDSGSWAIPLSTAKTSDGSQYAVINKDDNVAISVQGKDANSGASLNVSVQNAQPAPNITIGQTTSGTPSSQATAPQASTSAGLTTNLSDASSSSPLSTNQNTNNDQTNLVAFATSPSPTVGSGDNSNPFSLASGSGTIADQNPSSSSDTSQTDVAFTNPFSAPSSTAAAQLQTDSASGIVDMSSTATTKQVVQTTQPIITGQAAPNIKISVTIHSQNAISTQASTDSQGNYIVDLSALQQQLSPGTHTVTVSYTDPQTGKTVTTTKTFTVAANSLALASSSPQPFGSSNPFPVVSPSPSVAPLTSMPSTSSSLPRTGSVSTTYMVLFSGLFFLVAGVWSFAHSRRIVDTREL